MTNNQIGNAKNPYQGATTKALCVCSAGLLRSPSIAKYLTEKGYNTRACGTAEDYALIPISPALLYWADEIHVVKEQLEEVRRRIQRARKHLPSPINPKIYVYNIPDCFGTFEKTLMETIHEEYTSFNS